MAKTAFIGLGVMGYPMAGHLRAKGHEVTVFNRTAARGRGLGRPAQGRARRHARRGGEGCGFRLHLRRQRPRRAQRRSTGRRACWRGCARARCWSTTRPPRPSSPARSRRRPQEPGIDFLDAPVSGGQAGAEKGQLTVMVGGEQAAFDRAKPVIDAYARACVLLGAHGSGQLAKMVNQICIAGVVQGLAEGAEFRGPRRARRRQADRDASPRARPRAGRWRTAPRPCSPGKFDFGFAVDWMRKDLGICLDEAKRNGARLPATALVDQFYAQVQARGGAPLGHLEPDASPGQGLRANGSAPRRVSPTLIAPPSVHSPYGRADHGATAPMTDRGAAPRLRRAGADLVMGQPAGSPARSMTKPSTTIR